MAARHRGGVEADGRLGIAANHVLARWQREAQPAPLNPAAHRAGLHLVLRLAAKCVAAAMDRAHVFRLAAPIVQRRSDLADEIRQVGFDDEGARPEQFDQLGLPHDGRPPGDEQREQVERFRRQVHGAGRSRQLTGVEVEREFVEAQRHRGS